MAKNLSVKGKIIEVLPIKKVQSTKGDLAFQDYVIEVNGDFPTKIMFSVYGQDKINTFNIKEGDSVEVFFNITANKWKERWLNTIRAWKVNNLNNPYQNNNPAPQSYVQSAKSQKQEENKDEATDVNSLPF